MDKPRRRFDQIDALDQIDANVACHLRVQDRSMEWLCGCTRVEVFLPRFVLSLLSLLLLLFFPVRGRRLLPRAPPPAVSLVQWL